VINGRLKIENEDTVRLSRSTVVNKELDFTETVQLILLRHVRE